MKKSDSIYNSDGLKIKNFTKADINRFVNEEYDSPGKHGHLKEHGYSER